MMTEGQARMFFGCSVFFTLVVMLLMAALGEDLKRIQALESRVIKLERQSLKNCPGDCKVPQ